MISFLLLQFFVCMSAPLICMDSSDSGEDEWCMVADENGNMPTVCNNRHIGASYDALPAAQVVPQAPPKQIELVIVPTRPPSPAEKQNEKAPVATQDPTSPSALVSESSQADGMRFRAPLPPVVLQEDGQPAEQPATQSGCLWQLLCCWCSRK